MPRPVFTKAALEARSSSPPRPSNSQTTYKAKDKKRAVFKPIKSPAPLYPINHSPEKALDELSDADGDTDQDKDENDGSTAFDESHPFFQSLDRDLSYSPQKKSTRNFRKSSKVIVIDDSDEEWPSRTRKPRRIPTPAIVLVEDSDEESNHDSASDSEEETLPESFDRLIDPKHWNEEPFAFGRYLLSFLDTKGRKYSHISDDFFEDKKVSDPFENDDTDEEVEEAVKDEDYVEEDSMHQAVVDDDDDEYSSKKATPALTNGSTSPHKSSSLPPSSPFVRGLLSSSPAGWNNISDSDISFASSLDPFSLSPDSSLKLHPTIVASHYPNKKYTFTPAPPKAKKHRVRLDRMERKMNKGKKAEYLCAADEPDEDTNAKGDVDELGDDKENDKWVRPKLKPGEIWDPFGDEPEI